jgi:transglutaminase-like putative cysteine protease
MMHSDAGELSRRFTVTHTTTYTYEPAVRVSHSVLRLKPRATDRLVVHRSSIAVNPGPDTLQDHHDVFGNVVTWVSMERPHAHVEYRSNLEVTVQLDPTALQLDPTALQPMTVGDSVAAAGATDDLLVRWMRLPSSLVPDGLVRERHSVLDPSRPLVDALRDVLQHMADTYVFDPQATTVSTPLAEVMRRRAGVCQDFAHVLLAILRSQGVAARYVSGYLETAPPPGTARLVGADASHAWVSVWSGQEWIDVDPTNNCFVGLGHVPIAVGRDYADVAPTRGVTIGPPHRETLVTAVDTVAHRGLSQRSGGVGSTMQL